ncbi:hypothetical protein [Marinobacter salarius]|uniref:hypothetical protein n=1 Tax=Marinobacter salarius TaxID=1420917 RepID=UPI0018F14A92|nr:hypothetical protein [Marinobacter salarius]MBJ7301706.1 hypothetical protein [Marinobacter salarius]HIO29935.1 hypothetical protein [Marinobacter salarius]HIP00304.1 hypothetical protein [Marinobacter salarius]
MKKIAANIVASAIYSSFLGSVVIFIGMVASFIGGGWDFIADAIGAALLFYFITAIVSCLLAIVVAGPIYVLLSKYGLANYYSAFCFGLAVTFVCFGFSTSIENLYWNLAGGVIGLLFHYHYVSKPGMEATSI